MISKRNRYFFAPFPRNPGRYNRTRLRNHGVVNKLGRNVRVAKMQRPPKRPFKLPNPISTGTGPVRIVSSTMVIASVVAGLIFISCQWRFVRGSTLVGPWSWSVLFFTFLVVVTVFPPTASQSQPIHYLMACLSFCPTVALLGAKRPQHQMWQFVVASFAGMMALPAVEVLVLQPGQALALFDLRGWFLWGLIIACWINRWGTRYHLSATLCLIAQLLALAPQLPLWRSSSDHWDMAVAIWGATAVIDTILSQRTRRGLHRWDALWRDYRDRFGLVWAARVRERVNSTALSNEWDLELTWSGFTARTQDCENDLTSNPQEWDPEMARKLAIVFANVLRRFLSREELERRANELLTSEEPLLSRTR